MTKKTKQENFEKAEKLKCGLVMPISAFDECAEQHWADVRGILTAAIENAGFQANLVSDADDVGIIQKRIIQNLYDNPIVVCDVSGKNPNVMFELGIRLAFDKPTIIVKDNVTTYSFDTAPIEHLEYPRDLRFNNIVTFKNELRDKIVGTHKKATEDDSYTTFLKHFGQFHISKLETKEVSKEDFIIEELRSIRRAVNRLNKKRVDRNDLSTRDHRLHKRNDIDVCLNNVDSTISNEAVEFLTNHPEILNLRMVERGHEHFHLTADVNGRTEHVEAAIRSQLSEILHESTRGEKSQAKIEFESNSFD